MESEKSSPESRHCIVRGEERARDLGCAKEMEFFEGSGFRKECETLLFAPWSFFYLRNGNWKRLGKLSLSPSVKCIYFFFSTYIN